MELPKIVSTDDHVVEPPHTFKGRVPARFAERAPKIVEWPTGADLSYFPFVEIKVANGSDFMIHVTRRHRGRPRGDMERLE